MRKANWIRVRDFRDQRISKSLIYKWHHMRENLHLFSKVGGCLFIDQEAVEELFERGRMASSK